MTATITGIVHTKNEERNIRRALLSLAPVCDELLVVDMQSTDRTREIAESLGAKVLSVPDYGYVEPAIREAWEHVTTDWILRIDADEVVPPALGREYRRIADAAEVDLVSNGRLNFMFGERVNGVGWSAEDDRHFFFFRRGSLDLGDANRIHNLPRPAAGAKVQRLECSEELCVWHFSYTDWSQFVTKINRYTSVEADELGEVGVSGRGFLRLLVALLREFGNRFVKGAAWRDGLTGLLLVWMMLTYRVLSFAKARQLHRVGDVDAIERIYDDLAEALRAGERGA